MADFGTMDIFKLLPAAKKSENANCKKCGCSGCMMFAVKLAKGEITADLCPCIPDELNQKLSHSRKIQQKTVQINGTLKTLTIGGEKVMYRHEKTFLTPPPLIMLLNFEDKNFDNTLQKLASYRIENIGEEFRIEGVCLKKPNDEAKSKIIAAGLNFIEYDEIKCLQEILDVNFPETLNRLEYIRYKAIVEKDENFSDPVFIHLKDASPKILCAKASAYICKYASLLLFDYFDEALFTTLYLLRQNIFTDPEMPLQVEAKVYEFNNPDENALVFLTTNFALSYFAVANEISNLQKGAYLVITPSDGMSVLTAWSAQKITAEIASRVVAKNCVLNKVKNKQIIIPGLLADLKEELEAALPGWKVVVGTVEAYKIPEFVRNLEKFSG